MRRIQKVVITGVALSAIAAAGVVVATNDSSTGDDTPTRVTTGTATVTRTDVAEREPVTGLLGHRGDFTVIATGQGTITRLPSVGQFVKRGQAAYEVDGKAVALLVGDRPAWRDFKLGMSDGSDVLQLETNLKELGHGRNLTVDDHFSYATYYAIRDWQEARHRSETGAIPLGQIVFVSEEMRVSAQDLKLGQTLQPGQPVLHGTGNERAVTVNLTPANAPKVKVGDTAIVTLPDGSRREGHISEIGAVATQATGPQNGQASGQQAPTAPVTVLVKGTIEGFLDQAQVQVLITTNERKNVLAVPTIALRALPEGKYEVIVVNGTSRQHIAVKPGLFDETTSMAEISGSGLSEGQQVEVPSGSA
ncbi:HlyD family efflux transporter periplasmic adaptor subunit [Dactylosporangium sp. NPDC050688]|uniref:HlyD family efflux transporter periplasmic adaptor subunit n=1 Tax=Dactylosporangium sp. NPDC050688 TaxID=3157217 RepID=UPI0033C63B68